MFKDLFGDKSWYESLTGVGVVLFAAVTAGTEAACAAEIMTAETCASVQTIVTKLSAVLVALGIRRAAA
jgi:uncharacterized membrane protein